MQSILASCHSTLDIAYLGMDGAAFAASAKAALDPQAQLLASPQEGTKAAQPGPSGLHSRLSVQSMHSMAAVESALSQLAGCLDAQQRLADTFISCGSASPCSRHPHAADQDPFI